MAYTPPLNGGRLNASIAGNTAGASTLISTGTMYLAGGNNVTLSQNGQSITISGANAPSGSINFSASNTSANLASVTFGNANGVSFGLNAGAITASHNALTSQSNQAVSAGTQGSSTFQTLSFANSNGVSWSTGTQGLYATVATNYLTTARASNDAIGLNTAQTNVTWTVNSGGLSLNAAGYAGTGFSGTNASGTVNSNGLQLSVAAGGGGGSNTFGMSNLGNTSGTTGVVSGSAVQYFLAGGNNVTLSQSINGSSGTVTISAASQSNQTANFYVSSNSTQLSSTAGIDLRSVTFQGAGIASVGLSGGKVLISVPSGGGGGGIALANSQSTYTSGTVNLVGDNNVSIYTDLNQSLHVSIPGTSSMSATGAFSISTNGATISMGVPAFSAGVSNLGNTSGNTGTVSNQIVFAGGNNVSLSQSTNAGGATVTINASGGGGGGIALAGGLAGSSTTITNGTANLSVTGGAMTISGTGSTLNFSVPATSSLAVTGAMSMSVNGSTVSLGAPIFDFGISSNTAGTAGTVSNGLVLAGGNNITLSQSTDANGATVTMNAANGGSLGNWEPIPLGGIQLSSTQISSSNQNTVYIGKLQPQAFVSASQLLQLISMTVTSASNSTYSGALSIYAGIYASTTGSSMTMLSSGSTNYTLSISSTNGTANLTGLRGLTMPLNVSMTPGNYWIALLSRTTVGTIQGFTQSMVFPNTTQSYSYMGLPGAAAAGSQGILEGVGYFSTSTSALPSAIAMSAIVQSNFRSYLLPYFAFKNTTW